MTPTQSPLLLLGVFLQTKEFAACVNTCVRVSSCGLGCVDAPLKVNALRPLLAVRPTLPEHLATATLRHTGPDDKPFTTLNGDTKDMKELLLKIARHKRKEADGKCARWLLSLQL